MTTPEVYRTGLISLQIDPLKTKQITQYLAHVCREYRVNIEQQDELSEDAQVQVILFSQDKDLLTPAEAFIRANPTLPTE